MPNLRQDQARVLKNFLYLASLKGVDIIIPIVTIPYLINTVGIGNFGLLVFSLSMATYLGSLMQYGFNVTAVREISRARNSPDALSKIYSTTLVAQWILVVFSLLIFILAIELIATFKEHRLMYYSSMFLVVGQAAFPAWLFQGIERMQFIAIMSTLAKLSYLVMLLCFIQEPGDFLLVHFLNGVSFFVVLIIGFYLIRYKTSVRYKKPTVSEISSVYRKGFNSFLNQLLPSLYNNSAVFLLGMHGSAATVGIYSAASTLAESVVSIGRIASAAFLPYLSQDIKRHRKFQTVMIFSGLVLSAALFFLAERMVWLMFTEDRYAISVYVKWMSIGIVPAIVYLVYNTNYLMLVGQETWAAKVTVLTSFFFFFVALITIPIWQINAVVAVVLGARAVMAMWSFLLYKRIVLNNG